MNTGSDASTPQSPPRRSGFPRVRFSLRTLLLTVLLIASSATLWWNWGPWKRAFSVDEPGSIGDVLFSDDDRTTLFHFNSKLQGEASTWSSSLDVRDASTGHLQRVICDPRHEGFVIRHGDYVAFRPSVQRSANEFTYSFSFLPSDILFNIKTGKEAGHGQIKQDAYAWFNSHFVLFHDKHESVSTLVSLPDFTPVPKPFSSGFLSNDDVLIGPNDDVLDIYDLKTKTVIKTQRVMEVPISDSYVYTSHKTVFYTITIKNGTVSAKFVNAYDLATGALRMKREGVLLGHSADGMYCVIANPERQTITCIGLAGGEDAAFDLLIPVSEQRRHYTGEENVSFSEDNRYCLDHIDGNLYDVHAHIKLWEKPAARCRFASGGAFVVVHRDNVVSIVDVRTGTPLVDSRDLRWRDVLKPHASIYFDNHACQFAVVCGDWNKEDDDQRRHATVWRLCRPVEWYGIAWLPEFWLTLALALGLLVSIPRVETLDWRIGRSGGCSDSQHSV